MAYTARSKHHWKTLQSTMENHTLYTLLYNSTMLHGHVFIYLGNIQLIGS